MLRGVAGSYLRILDLFGTDEGLAKVTAMLASHRCDHVTDVLFQEVGRLLGHRFAWGGEDTIE